MSKKSDKDKNKESSALEALALGGGQKLGLIAILVISVNTTVWSLIWPYSPKISWENHIIENLQIVFLFIGSSIFFISSYRSSDVGIRVLFLGLGLFNLTFLLRELELDQFKNLFKPLVVLNAPIRNYWLTVAWLFSGLIFLRTARDTLKAFFDWIKSMSGRLMVIGGLFYLLADLFDKNVFGLSFEKSKFYEESLEINATTFMIICAVLAMLRTEKINLQRFLKFFA